MRCLRKQLKSSAEAAIILEQSRAIQGIPKTQRELKAERGKVWTRLFFSTLFLSLIFNAIDIGSDTLILIRYWRELSKGEKWRTLNMNRLHIWYLNLISYVRRSQLRSLLISILVSLLNQFPISHGPLINPHSNYFNLIEQIKIKANLTIIISKFTV